MTSLVTYHIGNICIKASQNAYLTYCHLVWHIAADLLTEEERIQERAAFRAGTPNDGFLQNALKTLFGLSRVLLDLKGWFSLATESESES